MTPYELEQALGELADQVEEAAKTVYGYQMQALDAEREYDAAFAKAFISYEGPQTEKKYGATLACQEQRQVMDVAAAELKYASARARALEAKLTAFQTIMRSMMASYSAAQFGKGA